MTVAFLVAMLASADSIRIFVPLTREPLKFGAGELRKALTERGVTAKLVGTAGAIGVRWKEGAPPAFGSEKRSEAYRLAPTPGGLLVSAGDDAGGMYALLDLAERVRTKGLAALKEVKQERRAPAVPFRAVNPFLSIPPADKNGRRDWEHWWFTDMSYWRGYLDLLARSRINWIDMHGMYDLQTTLFPNMWPYFVVSEKFPDVGMPPEQARGNLKALATIVKMAKDRGIRFGLMNYTGGWNWPGARTSPERPVADFIEYTKEGVVKILTAVPDLAMIGFRIGESGYGEDFYAKSYLAALDELGKPVPLYTRTWGADKKKLMELGAKYPGKFKIQIKYNGEQMGPPWHIAGGRMTRWRDYSYQDYLFYPRAYDVIWQVRANGTNRVFQWASYARIRDCVKTTTLAGSVGYTVEPMSAYFPVNDFLHKKPLFKWEYERNSLWYLMWGRLGYDPKTPEELFRTEARRKWGPGAYELMQAMSEVVPLAINSYNIGPDHRDHAPELETGGSIRQWANGQPFDSFYAQSPREAALARETGVQVGKVSCAEGARRLLEAADRIHALLPKAAKVVDLQIDAKMLEHLARYYGTRLKAAEQYALAERNPDWGEDVGRLTRASADRWRELAEEGDRWFKPFTDRLRMHTETYLWSQSSGKFAQDEKDLRTMLVSDARALQPAEARSVSVPGRVWPSPLDRSRDGQKLLFHAKIGNAPAGAFLRGVNLMWKPLRSEADWMRAPMDPVGDEWHCVVDVDAQGGMFGLEIVTSAGACLTMTEGRPYGVIDPWEVKR